MEDAAFRVFAQIAKAKQTAERRYLANKEAILTAMREVGVTKIHVGYSGSGDSGCVDAVDVTEGKNIDMGAITVTVSRSSSKFADGRWIEAESQVEISLHEAAEEFAYDWLQAHHLGWENNDGADGDIVFDLARGLVLITHNTHYIETNTEECSL